MAINVEFGSVPEDHVSSLVESGAYGSETAVLRAGLKLLQRREADFAALDAALDRGIAAAEAGDFYTIEDVRERLRQRRSVEALPISR